MHPTDSARRPTAQPRDVQKKHAFPWERWVKGVAHWREADTAFISVAFTWRLPEVRQLADRYRALGCTRIRLGGPGTFTMRKYITENLPDLELGGSILDTVVRHNSRATRASYGCPVGCHFCIVPKMDGKAFTLLPDFVPRPILCDDNLSALPIDFQKHVVGRYLATGTSLLDANSGFEPATFSDEVFALWKPVLKGPWRFGYDETTEGENVRRAFKMLKDVSPRKKQVYVMIGDEPFDLCMDRIETVIGHGGEPYAQPFIKLNALVKEPRIRHDWTAQRLRWVQRWTNRHLWRKIKFKDYDPGARTNKKHAFSLESECRCETDIYCACLSGTCRCVPGCCECVHKKHAFPWEQA